MLPTREIPEVPETPESPEIPAGFPRFPENPWEVRGLDKGPPALGRSVVRFGDRTETPRAPPPPQQRREAPSGVAASQRRGLNNPAPTTQAPTLEGTTRVRRGFRSLVANFEIFTPEGCGQDHKRLPADPGGRSLQAGGLGSTRRPSASHFLASRHSATALFPAPCCSLRTLSSNS